MPALFFIHTLCQSGLVTRHLGTSSLQHFPFRLVPIIDGHARNSRGNTKHSLSKRPLRPLLLIALLSQPNHPLDLR